MKDHGQERGLSGWPGLICAYAAIALILSGLGFSASSSAAAATPTSLLVTTVEGWSTAPVRGAIAFSVDAKVRIRTGDGYQPRDVMVERHQAGTLGWSELAAHPTDENGYFTVAVEVPSRDRYVYRVRVLATPTAAAALTATRRVEGIKGQRTKASGWSTSSTSGVCTVRGPASGPDQDG